jgi:hypothetical protein
LQGKIENRSVEIVRILESIERYFLVKMELIKEKKWYG